MSRLKLDQEDLGLSSLLERLTQVRIKDCFRDDEQIYVVVAPGEFGRAVGKGGETIKRVQRELGKRIRVIEFNENIKEFIRNIIHPLTVEEVVEEDGVIKLKDSSKKTKSLLIGRESRNLQLINRAVKRFFNVEVRVI